jgi:hypothetical protein
MTKKKRNITDKEIIKALRSSGGIHTHAAKALGVTRQNIGNRIRRSKQLKQVCDDIREENIEIAETELLKLVKKGDFKAIKFYLTCLAAAKGYRTEFRHELIGNVDHNIKIEKIERVIIDPTQKVEFTSSDPVIIDYDDKKQKTDT